MNNQSGKPCKPRRSKKQSTEHSAIQIISEIKQGNFNPKHLKKADRIKCVQYLDYEGASVSEIAHVLKVSGRTVIRDHKEIQQTNALDFDPKLPGQIAGKFFYEADAARSRILRAVRDRDTPAHVKVEAQRICFDIFLKSVQGVQSLGYLPKDAILPQLNGNTGDLPNLNELHELTSKLLDLDDQNKSSGSSHSSEQKS